MKLEEYKEKSGMSYRKIGKLLSMSFASVCYAVLYPWRTTLKTFLKIAKICDMPDNEARKEWQKSKIEYGNNKIKKEANI